MPKVYVTQRPVNSGLVPGKYLPAVDLSAAFIYGEPEYCCHFGEAKHDTSETLLFKFRERMAGITPQDYVLPFGMPITMALGAVVAGEVTRGKFNLLYWNREERRYQVVPVDLDALPPIEMELKHG
jgi:hypothetical protein